MSTTSAQRHTQHASSTRHATYVFALEIDALARLKVVKYACGCASLVRPMALLETLRDLPLHSVADAFVAALLPARYNNNRNNNSPPQLTTSTSVTLLLPFSPSAIKRPPTSVNSLYLCIARRHTRRQHPTSLSQSHPHFTHSGAMSRPSLPHMPLLTKLIFCRRLNRPRLAHSGRMPSSSSCCSVGREAHVASVDDKCATPHTARVINTPCNVRLCYGDQCPRTSQSRSFAL